LIPSTPKKGPRKPEIAVTIPVPGLSFQMINDIVRAARKNPRLFPTLTHGRTRPATILRVAVMRGVQSLFDEMEAEMSSQSRKRAAGAAGK